MIEQLKILTDGIVNRSITGDDLFRAHKEIYRDLEGLSADQFAEPRQVEFTLARGMFSHLSNPNRHEVITGEKVIAAAKRLRPVLDQYLGPKPAAPVGATHFTLTTIGGDHYMGDKININGNVTGSGVGSNASLKALDIVTQIQQSGLDADLKQKFVEAAEALAKLNISDADKSDAADDLTKLNTEMEKPTRDEGRIRKIWNRIKDIAPTVATILASAVSIGKIVEVVTELGHHGTVAS